MAIPDFQSLTLPLLRIAEDGKEHTMAEARETLARQLGVSDEDRNARLRSGRRSFDNRVAWAKAHCTSAALLESPRPGAFKITERGRELLREAPARVDLALLARYPESLAARSKAGAFRSRTTAEEPSLASTPEEQIEQAYRTLREAAASELLARVKANSPEFFERLVVDLLLKMGYGGGRAGAGRTIGRSGDEGVDGLINEDVLGLDTIYIQAKRWERKVGRPDVQAFVGALHGKRARKGVFLTTGAFSNEAREYVRAIDARVVLIDGRELAESMLDLSIGVATKVSYPIPRIDSDYFEEE